MYLQRLLQINVATLAALATLLLGMGQDTPGKPLWVALAAAASIWLTDVKGWIRLSRSMASLIALPLVAYAAHQMLRTDGDTRILIVADLIVYLQVVLFFQKKETSIYWQLIVISLLEVVVAAFLSHGALFGVLLAIYMMAGLSALALLLQQVQWSRYQAGPDSGRPAQPEQPEPPESPNAATEAVFSDSCAADSGAGIVGELFQRLAMVGVGTLVLTLVIFFTVPRLGHPAWRGVLPSPRSTVGFSDTVTLGQLGEILESREEVMRVQLTYAATNQPYPVQSEFYLRGAVLTHYDHGQWTSGRRVGPAEGTPPSEAEDDAQQEDDNQGDAPPGGAGLGGTGLGGAGLGGTGQGGAGPSGTGPSGAGQGGTGVSPVLGPGHKQTPRGILHDAPVCQSITIEPLDRDELFAIWPLVVGRGNRNLFFDRARGRLMRRSDLRPMRFKYRLETTAFFNGELASLTPCNDPGMGEADNDRPADLNALLQMPPMPHLVAQAWQWVAICGTHAPRLNRARLLESRLNQSDRFEYSLQGQPRDPALDPIEDFIANHPRGHCEYFATALALMLRSQGIPTRVVVGYKCEDWNKLGKFYQVRQSDAHAWVEAYLTPQDIPQQLRWGHGPRRWSGGAWLRLDPTPGSRDLLAGGKDLSKWQQGLNWINSLWSDYVMEMDRQRQQEAIYQPAIKAIKDLAHNMFTRKWWRSVLDKIGNALNLRQWNGLGSWLLHVALPLFVGLVLVVLACRRVWRSARRLWRRLAGRPAGSARRARPRVEFYRRFEALLARQGLVRGAGQTPREFAAAAAFLSTSRETTPEPFSTVVEAFYRVRFGGLPLDNPQREAVEHELAELELLAAGHKVSPLPLGEGQGVRA